MLTVYWTCPAARHHRSMRVWWRAWPPGWAGHRPAPPG